MSAPPRLFVDVDLSAGNVFAAAEPQAHYLLRVMRLGEGAPLVIFNGRDGEWRAEISTIQGKKCQIRCIEQTRPQTAGSDLWLLFAPLKTKARMSYAVEKATELGVARLLPVTTSRTQTDRIKTERLQATVTEAAEQTERLDVPQVEAPQSLAGMFENWDPSRQLIFADESGDNDVRVWDDQPGRGAPLAAALRENGKAKAAILIGPEGGFAPEERAILRSQDFVMPVTLGPRILRAETAVVSALTIWQSVLGDWR